MFKKQYFFILFLMGIAIFAQERIKLWESGKMPNSKGLTLENVEENFRIKQVKEPEIYVFLPPKEARKSKSVLIIPGGGYQHLTYNLGGFQFAKWLNSLGISAFVLIYRLPTSSDLLNPEIGPLQDAQAAMKIIRNKSQEWLISPDEVGVLGTSAGGHLAAMLSNWKEDVTQLKDTVSTIPNFCVLISPVIDFGKYAHQGSLNNLLGKNPTQKQIEAFSLQNQVTENTPPTFLVHAQDDKSVPVNNSILYFNAMTEKNVVGSLFIAPEGGHNIGIVNKIDFTDQWKDLFIRWIETLKPKNK